ncbi:MAG: Hint domain-containing protein [Acetobacteraceae bacterium]|nr:Hint domain-containing protein [Acetobacteraceae bacterium]
MATIVGDSGANSLTGTSAPDSIFGRNGNDSIRGEQGGDFVRGGKANDQVTGNGGDDQVAGGAGEDRVSGARGDDEVRGGQGSDTIRGGDGNDTLRGGDGDDKIIAGDGDDQIYGGKGIDTVVIRNTQAESTITFGQDENGRYTEVSGPNGVDRIYGAEFIKFSDGTVPICFYPGTLIRTPTGEAPVESLAAGDLVLTHDGRTVAVRWMGRQTVATRFADPVKALPIRIRAGALAESVPSRDLLVSPAHALLVGGVLVQAGALVNGSTITREATMPEVFTYWHVETADHSLIMAEGAPAETFVDNVDREAFDNWAEYVEIVGNAAPVPEMDLPRAKSHRQVPQAVREQIAARAAALLGDTAAAA